MTIDAPDDEYTDATCPKCLGEGSIIICIDDLCLGADYCWHGDGEILCPECGESGEIYA